MDHLATLIGLSLDSRAHFKVEASQKLLVATTVVHSSTSSGSTTALAAAAAVAAANVTTNATTTKATATASVVASMIVGLMAFQIQGLFLLRRAKRAKKSGIHCDAGLACFGFFSVVVLRKVLGVHETFMLNVSYGFPAT